MNLFIRISIALVVPLSIHALTLFTKETVKLKPTIRVMVLVEGVRKYGPVLLECDPNGTGFPNADQACAKLQSIDGILDSLEPNPAECPDIKKEVTVTLDGNYGGSFLVYRRVFKNEICARSTLGPLYP
ncbi:hypothetical protein CU098_004522 [Rhizopus stolonifer]|uniref:Subtilisin inhibitor domain-containing protein n=1 Tax=Rhizopus stolonifer TaxID=4846 RepID=A0A367IJT8_RHIST|nr:hypothetical protein CU098_004522 [Rhizopus stolonifer]